jgi:putative permease
MAHIFSTWFRRYFSDPEAIILLLLLITAIFLLAWIGDILTPLLASLVIAYLLQGIVSRLERLNVPHVLAVILVFFVFLGLCFFAVLGLVPLLWTQANHLISELPSMVNQGQLLFGKLAATYPSYVSEQQLHSLLLEFKTEFARAGQVILSASISSIPTIIMLAVYFVLVPVMVYFFLMDKSILVQWLKKYLPQRRTVIRKLWLEVHRQIGNYIRGKVLEIILVTVVCLAFFSWIHLPYSVLLSVLVGLSTIVPYVGAVVVTIPIVLVGFFQWGWHASFAYLLIGYTIIVILDGNVLVPLLFSEAVSLHPIAIILAVLFFGGIWGFWGVFFAIPLAIVVKAVLAVWPKVPLDTSHAN